MLRTVKKPFVPDPAVMEMRQTLARRITAITGRALHSDTRAVALSTDDAHSLLSGRV